MKPHVSPAEMGIAKFRGREHTRFIQIYNVGEDEMKLARRIIFLSCFFMVTCAGAAAQSPPSEAQIKKDVMNPGVIAIIFRGQGSFDKYVSEGAVVNEYYRSI